jgi:hypothetical protein
MEKSAFYQIESQFPAAYKENGRELIELTKSYYKFLEDSENQSVYNSRRIFEYRDIDTTLEKMLIFFKNKYLRDLPYNEENQRFLVKKIIDLYRRRGSEDGLKLFFRMFYEQDVKVYYPSEDIFKPSSSEWVVGKFLQLFPDTDIFSLRVIIGKRIVGSVTKAEAVVDKINFFLLNGTLTPVLYISDVAGSFSSFDNILSLIDGNLKVFGKVNGSLDSITIDTSDPESRSGYSVGDILDCACIVGNGAKVIVSQVTENFTGEIVYTIIEGGFGYTADNTRLIVSDQTMFINNTNRIFTILETLEDQFGNRGVVIGQNDIVVGIKMENDDEFNDDSIIETVDRDVNFVVPITEIVPKNSTSPGLLYPDVISSNTATPEDIETAVIAVLDNTETVTLISDKIENFLNVQLNAADYNLAPALLPMSGTADPVNIDTPLSEAFDLEPFDIGRIVRFDNINPGSDYTSQVFALAIDPVILAYDQVDQIITIVGINSGFTVGEIVSQGSTNGIIRSVTGNSISITPYSYYGFSENLPLTFRNTDYTITTISKDYSSRKYGFNSIVDTITDFAVGKVQSVNVINSGIGYIDGSRIRLRDANNTIAAVGVVSAKSQGVSEGFWKTFSSHANIYDNKRIQDSFFYQDYSYEITSQLDINNYEATLKDVAHLAGTKVFGKFALSAEANISSNIRSQLEF